MKTTWHSDLEINIDVHRKQNQKSNSIAIPRRFGEEHFLFALFYFRSVARPINWKESTNHVDNPTTHLQRSEMGPTPHLSLLYFYWSMGRLTINLQCNFCFIATKHIMHYFFLVFHSPPANSRGSSWDPVLWHSSSVLLLTAGPRFDTWPGHSFFGCFIRWLSHHVCGHLTIMLSTNLTGITWSIYSEGGIKFCQSIRYIFGYLW